jgi:hypothetical protein
MPPEEARARTPAEEAEHMFGHGVQRHAFAEALGDVVDIGVACLLDVRCRVLKEAAVHIGENGRAVDGRGVPIRPGVTFHAA